MPSSTVFGEAGSGIDLAGQDFGGSRHQEHIVEGQGFADEGARFHASVYQSAPDSASAPARGTGKRGITA